MRSCLVRPSIVKRIGVDGLQTPGASTAEHVDCRGECDRVGRPDQRVLPHTPSTRTSKQREHAARACAHLCVCVCVCVYTCIHLYMFTYICTYIHTYIHTYRRTGVQTYKHIGDWTQEAARFSWRDDFPCFDAFSWL